MSSQGFSFPPPPPPPPQLPAHQPPAEPQSRHGQNRNGRGLDQRGRGKGHGSRGRGGHFARGGQNSSYPAPAGLNFAQPNYGGYPLSLPTAPYMAPSPYHHGQSSTFQNPQNVPAYQPQQFPPAIAQGNYLHYQNSQPPPSFQPQQFGQPGATGTYQHNVPPSFPTPEYMQDLPGPPHGHQSNNRAMVGSAPWYNGMQSVGSYMGAPGQSPGPRPAHGNCGPLPTQPHKRDHGSAFKKQPTAPRTPAAPAVPSFGNPLPSKPPPPADTTAGSKAKRRKRKHNQLGLTPHTIDPESSEDEAGEDEESKLAQSVSGAAPLEVSYKGRTSKLETASDIATWIAERKKKFPTQARIDEKKKAAEEAKAAREAARPPKNKAKRNKRKKHDQKQNEPHANSTTDPAMNDEQRREAIRRDLAREEQRILDAMAETNSARLRVEALRKEALSLRGDTQQDKSITQDIKTEPEDAASAPAIKAEPEDLAPELATRKEPHDTTPEGARPEDPIKTEQLSNHVLDNDMGLAPDHEASDWTSSSGSESDSDSNSDSDESAPEQASSRRTGPERVPPPPREGKKTVCRYFARNGHCNRGDQCKFLHDNDSERPKTKAKQPEKKEKDTRRKGLYQALLDRQREDEDRQAMEVILWLGQNNLLTPNQGT